MQTLLLSHAPATGPAQARPVRWRVLPRRRAAVSQGFLYPERAGADRSTNGACGRGRKGSTWMSQVFNAYAAYYDLLYRDKDYAGEAGYVRSLLSRHRIN